MQPLAAHDPRSIGRYRLRARLGAGGMGRVYLGVSPGGRAVAVKVVHPELAADPQFRRRFAAEVQAARTVGGFHTTPVVDADPDADPPWLVTAYIAGPSLAEVLAEHGPLPEATVRRLGAGLAEALEAVHAAGLVHRDLKPSNILLADDGPRVIDFGIARALDATALTRPGAVSGTPGYLAPERLNDEPAGPPADVFALGVVLCHAAGVRPFGDGPVQALLHRTLHEEPVLDGVPASLRDVVAACLAKDPGRRPTAAQLLGRLSDAPPGEAPTAWLPGPVRTMVTERVTAVPPPDTDGTRRLTGPPPEPAPPVTAPPPVPSVPEWVTLKGRRTAQALSLAGSLVLVIAFAFFLVALLMNNPDRTPSEVLLGAVYVVGMVGALRSAVYHLLAVAQPYEVHVGTPGIQVRYGGRTTFYGWEHLTRVSMLRVRGSRPLMLVVSPAPGIPTPRRSSLIRPYTLPLHRDRQERNWVVLAHLRELDRDSDQLARIIRTYAGSRWQE
ncbi:serine/threonine-protein kinase [Actinomadura keratinilytica]|uniref:Protein kinase domain-containing protein n=1 Tax=Actinomadura keratinilytica TaxID=547461 RepID=A0ABP7YJX3_9ACTN